MYEYGQLKYYPKCAGKFEKKQIGLDDRKRLICSSCGYVIFRNPLPGAAAIVELDNKIVMVKRGVDHCKGYWALPGGFVEYDESPEVAAIRETEEETGLKVKIRDLIGIHMFGKPFKSNVIGFCFAAKAISGELRSGSDVIEVKSFNPKKLPNKFAFPQNLKAIAAWIKVYGK